MVQPHSRHFTQHKESWNFIFRYTWGTVLCPQMTSCCRFSLRRFPVFRICNGGSYRRNRFSKHLELSVNQYALEYLTNSLLRIIIPLVLTKEIRSLSLPPHTHKPTSAQPVSLKALNSPFSCVPNSQKPGCEMPSTTSTTRTEQWSSMLATSPFFHKMYRSRNGLEVMPS